jgi:hypothetical protein
MLSGKSKINEEGLELNDLNHVLVYAGDKYEYHKKQRRNSRTGTTAWCLVKSTGTTLPLPSPL